MFFSGKYCQQSSTQIVQLKKASQPFQVAKLLRRRYVLDDVVFVTCWKHSFKQQNYHRFFPSNFCQKNADDFHIFRLDLSFTSQLFFESFHCQTFLRKNPYALDLESSSPGQDDGDRNKIPWCSSQHVPCVSLNKHRHVNMKNNIKTI